MKKRWIFVAMLVSMFIASLWNSYPPIKENAHRFLDPSIGALLNWNILWGFLFVILILSLATTLVQKYTTDQASLKEIKKEQKKLQEEMKQYEKHPEKLMELNKKQFEMMGDMMKISMGSIVYTAVPFILLFRWFSDYFAPLSYKFFGFFTWFWFYLIATMVLTSVLRKVMKVE